MLGPGLDLRRVTPINPTVVQEFPQMTYDEVHTYLVDIETKGQDSRGKATESGGEAEDRQRVRAA